MGGLDLGSSLGFLNPLGGGDQNIQNAAQANPEAVAQSSSAAPTSFADSIEQSIGMSTGGEDGQVPSFLQNLMPDIPSLPPALSPSGLKDATSGLFSGAEQPLQQLMGSLSPELGQALQLNSLMGGTDPVMNGLSSTMQSVANASSMATNMLSGMVPGMPNIADSLQGLGLPSPGPISPTASPAEQQSQLAANNAAVLGNFNEISQASLNGMPEGPSKDALSSFLAPFTQALPDLGGAGDTIKNTWGSIGGDTKDGLSNVGGGIKDGWSSIGSDTKDGIKDTAGSITDSWKGIGSDAKDGIKDTAGSIKDSWKGIGSDLKDGIKDTAGSIKDTWKGIGSDLKDGAKGTLDGIKGGWEGVGKGIKDGDLGEIASAAKDGVVNTNSAALGTVGNVAKDYGKGVIDTAKTAGGATIDVAKDYGKGVVDTAKTAGGATVDVVKDYGKGVVDTAKTAGGATIDVGKDYGSAMGNVGSSAFDATKQAGGDYLGGVGQMAGNLGAPLGQDLFGTGNAMQSLTGALPDMSSLGSLFGGGGGGGMLGGLENMIPGLGGGSGGGMLSGLENMIPGLGGGSGGGDMLGGLENMIPGLGGGNPLSALSGDPIASLTSSLGSTLTGALSPLLSPLNMLTGNSSALMGGNPLGGSSNMLNDMFSGQGLGQAFQSVMNPMTALCGNLPLMGDLFGAGQQTPQQLEGMSSATSAVVNEGGQHLAQVLGASGDNANLIGQTQTLMQQMMAAQNGAGESVQPQIMNTLAAMTNNGTATGTAGQFNEAYTAGASGDTTAMMQALEGSLSSLGMDPNSLSSLYDGVNQSVPNTLTGQGPSTPTFFGAA